MHIFANPITHSADYSCIIHRLICANLKECYLSALKTHVKLGGTLLNVKVDLKYRILPVNSRSCGYYNLQ